MPNGDIKYAYRVSRLVILPDYQGLGFGTKFLSYIAEYYFSKGKKLYIRTTHLRLVNYLRNNSSWKESSTSGKVSTGGKTKTTTKKLGIKDQQLHRIAYSFQYMGKNYNIKQIKTLLIEDENIDYDLLKQDLEYLSSKFWIHVITGEINTYSRIEEICSELGIYTTLLYRTRNKNPILNKKYINKKINTSWNIKKHNYIMSHY